MPDNTIVEAQLAYDAACEAAETARKAHLAAKEKEREAQAQFQSACDYKRSMWVQLMNAKRGYLDLPKLLRSRR